MKLLYTYFWKTLPIGALIWLARTWLIWAQIAQPTSNHLKTLSQLNDVPYCMYTWLSHPHFLISDTHSSARAGPRYRLLPRTEPRGPRRVRHHPLAQHTITQRSLWNVSNSNAWSFVCATPILTATFNRSNWKIVAWPLLVRWWHVQAEPALSPGCLGPHSFLCSLSCVWMSHPCTSILFLLQRAA